MKYPDYFHFFSWHTKISLELPVGFEEEAEYPGENRAIYADDLDNEEEKGAKVLTKALRMPEITPAALKKIAENSTLISGNALLSTPEEFILDGIDAVKQYISHTSSETGEEILRCEVFAGTSDLLFMIILLCDMNRKDDYTPVFERTVDTARIILL